MKKHFNRWAKILHISSTMEKNLLDLKDASNSRDMSHHKEERRSRIVEDEKYREKIRNFLSTCINTFVLKITQQKLWTSVTQQSWEHTGKLSNKDKMLTNALRSVANKLKNFIKHFTIHLVSKLKLCISFRKVFE